MKAEEYSYETMKSCMKQHFNIIETPLAAVNLIEASAGTGKTFAIAGLFLRLLIEKKMNVDQILVVTFTEAATAELKDRILSLLRKAFSAFSTGNSDENFLRLLLQKYPDHETVRNLLNDAIRSFDQAAIFTIHGFCLRILQEHAFESGSLFDTELMVNQNSIYQEIAEDFWRSRFYNNSSYFIHFVLNRDIGPDTLWPSLVKYISIPNLTIVPEIEIRDSTEAENNFQRAFLKAASTWQATRTEIVEILTRNTSLNRNQYRMSAIPLLITQMDDMAKSSGRNPDLFPEFEKLTAESIRNAVKKNGTPPSHPFFDCCSELQRCRLELEEIHTQKLRALKMQFFEYLKHETFTRSRQRNVRTFQDLLLDCYRILEEENRSENLSDSVRKQYAAALIDEFQDTDPIQYAIFHKLFGMNEHSILFLIGDPKQAIYGFRGADIFAYLKAAAVINTRYTLGQNWRSETGLINAVNTIFGNVPAPFVFTDIQYTTIQAAEGNTRIRSLVIDGKPVSSIRMWVMRSRDGKEISKEKAYELIPRAVAAEISRLLSKAGRGEAILGKKNMDAGDIAVLVRKNREAVIIHQALSDLNIPSVIHSSGNIFDSFEAMEMERLLRGIANPGSERMIRSALTTRLFGFHALDLAGLMADDNGLERQFANFRKYHELWQQNGFIRMFSIFLRNEKVQERLMSYTNGERRYTNIRHLAEILHQVSLVEKKGISDLLSWFQKQRDPNQERLDEHQLRLESDDNAVRVVTVHKSKGLEYPIVFCPFTWEASRLGKKDDLFSFHDENNSMNPTLDFGSGSVESIQKAERELLSENLRLLYVAITRAKNLCYLVWGRFRGIELSAPAVLFHPDIQKTGMDDDNTMRSDLFRRLDKKDCGIQILDMPEEAGRPLVAETGETVPLECRKFKSAIDRSWRFSSFSSLVRHGPADGETADRELDDQREVSDFSKLEESEESGRFDDIFLFPKGTKSGTCLHELMEHLDFSNRDPSVIRKTVSEKLGRYGFDLKWTEVVSTVIRNILEARLNSNHFDFRLVRIPERDRITEFEFCFPTRAITPEKLKKLFAGHAHSKSSMRFADRIEDLDSGVLGGFMKGFIDLVLRYEGRFYLLDWKSNYLGRRKQDYCQDALAAIMEKDLYILQYHIYTVALDRYLSKRLPGYSYEKHFGGVYYVFMRAFGSMNQDFDGIYTDKPVPELIQGLSNLFNHFENGKSG